MLRCSTFVILVVTHPKPLLAQLVGAFLWALLLPTSLVEGRLAHHVDLELPATRSALRRGKGKRGGDVPAIGQGKSCLMGSTCKSCSASLSKVDLLITWFKISSPRLRSSLSLRLSISNSLPAIA